MKILFALLLAATPLAAQVEISPPDGPPDPPRYTTRQGQTLVIALNPLDCYGLTLEAMGRTCRCDERGILLLGAAYDQEPGSYELVAHTYDESRPLATIVVAASEFARSTKTVGSRPKPPSKERLAERAAIAYALTTGEARHPWMKLQAPWQTPLAEVKVTNSFGLYREHIIYRGARKRRRIVDQWTARHEGVDLRAPTGTVVRAPAHGVVVHAARTSMEGRMVIVYHGGDVYTLSLHLSRIKVHEGQYVEVGDPLGTSGATGITQGAHLHYATKVCGAYVDPEAFIETINNSNHLQSR